MKKLMMQMPTTLMTEPVYPISFPGAFGSGELKGHRDLGQENKEGAQAEQPSLVVRETVQSDFCGRTHCHE